MKQVTLQCPSHNCNFRITVLETQQNEISQCVFCGESLKEIDSYRIENTRIKSEQPNLTRLEIFLDNIRSAYNVGSIFRTSDGAGIRRIHLGGVTSTPDNPKVSKTALGASKKIVWKHHKNGVQAIQKLKQEGFTIWGLELTLLAENLFSVNKQVPQKLILVIGNEVSGIDPEILNQCDRVLYLPMNGSKGSLNVASAGAIAIYHLSFAC